MVRIIKKTFNTTVSVKEGASRSVLRGIIQYDTLNEVNIRLSDGSKAFDYTGYTNIVFKVLKADGTSYIDSEGENVIATSPVDGIITVILSGQATAAAGLCQSVIEVYSGDGKITTARFNYEVFEALGVDETAVVSDVEYPLLQNLLSEMSDIEAEASVASGYAARAEAAAETAEMWARAAQDIAEGDYATRAELEAVAAGAAPAGYGLGGDCKTITDWNTATRSGWYRTTVADANNNSPDGMAWYGYVTAYGNFLVVQEVWHANSKNWANKAVRWLQNGVWSEWEYANPPMQVGVEYRTTERHNTLPVYTKMINAGVLPNNGIKTVAITDNVADIGYVISASAVDVTTGQIMPSGAYGGDASRQVMVGGNRSGITLVTNFDGSSATSVLLTVKYTKTTDT